MKLSRLVGIPSSGQAAVVFGVRNLARNTMWRPREASFPVGIPTKKTFLPRLAYTGDKLLFLSSPARLWRLTARHDIDSELNFETLSISPTVKQTASEDGAVLLDIEQGICFALNPIGLKIWEMLKQHSSLDKVVDSLEREFGVSRENLVADVRAFVSELKAQHLLAHSVGYSPKRGWLTKLLLWKFDNTPGDDLSGDGKHR